MRRPLLALTVLALAGCASAEKKVLEGPREAILTQRTAALDIDPTTAEIEVRLPEPENTTEWTQVGGYADHAPLHTSLKDRVVQVWSRSVGAGKGSEERLLNPPVVGSGKIFTLTTDNDLVALDAQSGKKAWNVEIADDVEDPVGLTGGLAVVGGTVFVTTGWGEVFAYGAQKGDLLWRVSVGAPVRAAPTVAAGRVYVVSNDNRLSVLSAVDGSLLWTHNGIEESIGILGGASPAVASNTVVVPYSSGEIYALNATDGTYLWNESLSNRVSGDPYSALVDVEASPVVVGDVIYAVNHNGQMTTFNLESGRRLWERQLSSTAMPWVAGNMVFLMTDDNQLVALHRLDGKVRWLLDFGTRAIDDAEEAATWTGPVLAGDRLLVVSSEGYVASVSPYTGKRLNLIKIEGGLSVPPVVAGDTVYFLTDDGDLVAFR